MPGVALLLQVFGGFTSLSLTPYTAKITSFCHQPLLEVGLDLLVARWVSYFPRSRTDLGTARLVFRDDTKTDRLRKGPLMPHSAIFYYPTKVRIRTTSVRGLVDPCMPVMLSNGCFILAVNFGSQIRPTNNAHNLE